MARLATSNNFRAHSSYIDASLCAADLRGAGSLIAGYDWRARALRLAIVCAIRRGGTGDRVAAVSFFAVANKLRRNAV